MAKTIKDIAEKILEENKDEIISVYDRYAGIIDGANAVLEVIEHIIPEHPVYPPDAIKCYIELANLVKELKSE